MIKIVGSIIAVFLVSTSIYTYTTTDINGNEINFNDFRNKKILIVNIATNSPNMEQLQQLEQLYQQYKDSMVVIGFPSNSFGNEPLSNSSIKSYVENTYNTHFLLASKIEVKGEARHPVYNWLTDINLNGMMTSEVSNDFQKYLIDRNGLLIGVFAPSVQPMDSLIQKAILEN